MISALKNNKVTVVALLFVLIVAGVSQGYNMYKYPYYENDEGTYMSQAHALFTIGKLAHYTYWYDHAPAGWIFIGFWAELAQPFTSTPFSIDSGRTFMWILHMISCVLVFMIAKRIRPSNIPAVIAVLLFSLSPLAVAYQRRVLLDNLCTFWSLISLFLIVGKNRKLSHYVFSAITFAIAVLSKETTVFFAPALLFTIFMTADKRHRNFALAMWIGIFGIICVSYPLYALLNGEFFPAGTALGGPGPHVSLLESLKYQSGRPGGFFLNHDSSFMINFRQWVSEDQLFLFGGLASTFIVSVLSLRIKEFRPVALMTLGLWFFFIRGGVVIEFYIVPAVPFMALCIGFTIEFILELVTRIITFTTPRRALQLAGATMCMVPFANFYAQNTIDYRLDQTTAQVDAVNWIKANVPTNAVILIDNYAYLDFYGIYPKAHYYWKADTDPAITDNVLHDTWCSVDYILSSPQVTADAAQEPLPIVETSLQNSHVLKVFAGDLRNFEVRKVDNEGCKMFKGRMYSATPY